MTHLTSLLESYFGTTALFDQRQAALNQLLSLPTSTKRSRPDRWHFPELSALDPPRALAEPPSTDSDILGLVNAEMSRLGLDSNDNIVIVLVNGRISSISNSLPAGLTIESAAASRNVQVVVPVRAANVHGHAKKTGLLRHHPFCLINSAFFTDGVVLSVDEGVAIKQQIVVVHANQGNGLVCARVQIRVTAGSTLNVVELHISPKIGDESCLSIPLTDAEIETDGTLNRVVVVANNDGETLHKATMVLCRGERSKYVCGSVVMRGEGLCRDEMRVSLEGEESAAELRGVSACLRQSSVHTQWYVEHTCPRTRSEVKLRSVIGGKATGFFRGHVYIGQRAVKTWSDMHSKALLLSPQSQAHGQPRLEIYNPDVQATHGSTVGHLDASQLYYLMARGIPFPEASTMITLAFCRDLVMDMAGDSKLRSALDARLSAVMNDILVAPAPKEAPDIDVDAVQAQFPILTAHRPHGQRLVYLDAGATTQKPASVIKRMNDYYERENANIHRGVYQLAETATEEFEAVRRLVARFIHSPDPREVIFCRGTTEAINLVASVAVDGGHLQRGDEVIITAMEHHSNIVPWQMACRRAGAKLLVVPLRGRYALDMDEFERLLSPGHTKIVSVVHVSNVLGTINPVREMARRVHEKTPGAWVLADGAQAVAHIPVDVVSLGVDFYAFSSHKMYGPTGVGCLYGRYALLETLPPYQGGGDMIKTVSFDHTEYSDVPQRFEAGTQDMGGVVGLGAAVQFLLDLGIPAVRRHEVDVMAYALRTLGDKVPGIHLLGPPDTAARSGAIAFTLDDVHPHDIGTLADQWGVAIRTGHHCCEPLHHVLGIVASARASLSVHTTRADIDALVQALVAQTHTISGAAAPAGSNVKPPTEDMQLLYRETVLNHNRHPHNHRAITHATHEADGFNPLCGDRVTMFAVVADGVIEDVAFQGAGCAVSQASASLLTVRLKGQCVDDLAPLLDSFVRLIGIQSDSEAAAAGAEEELGKGICVFAGLGRFPARVKCATLCWHTLVSAFKS